MRRGPRKEQSCADPLGTLPWLRRFTFTHPPTGGVGGWGVTVPWGSPTPTRVPSPPLQLPHELPQLPPISQRARVT